MLVVEAEVLIVVVTQAEHRAVQAAVGMAQTERHQKRGVPELPTQGVGVVAALNKVILSPAGLAAAVL